MPDTMTRSRADDELAIRALVATYSDAACRMDGAGMASIYAPDGVFELDAERSFQGTELITKVYRRLMEKDRQFVYQMLHSGLVELDGDRAKARHWFTELKRHTGEDFYRYGMACFEDEAVRLDIGWRVSRRRVVSRYWEELAPSAVHHHPLAGGFLPVNALPRG